MYEYVSSVDKDRAQNSPVQENVVQVSKNPSLIGEKCRVSRVLKDRMVEFTSAPAFCKFPPFFSALRVSQSF